MNAQIMHFSIKKKTKKYFFKWKLAGRILLYNSHLCIMPSSPRPRPFIGRRERHDFFRLKHGASGPHNERAFKAETTGVVIEICVNYPGGPT